MPNALATHSECVENGVTAALACAHVITTPRHPGLRLLIPDPRDPAPLSFTAPDAGLLRLLPIVGTPHSPVILLEVSESPTYVTLQWYIINAIGCLRVLTYFYALSRPRGRGGGAQLCFHWHDLRRR